MGADPATSSADSIKARETCSQTQDGDPRGDEGAHFKVVVMPFAASLAPDATSLAVSAAARR
jgi:hypothetical protein